MIMSVQNNIKDDVLVQQGHVPSWQPRGGAEGGSLGRFIR